MATVWSALVSAWNLLVYVISGIRIQDLIDIAVITFLIYKCIGFFRQTRAGQLIKGLVFLLAMAIIAQWFDLVMLKWLMAKIMDSILIIAVIIFHPEIRRALEHMGTSGFGSLNKSGMSIEDERLAAQIESASKAAGLMQEQKCGALMVFERTTQLGEIISTGTIIKASSSSALICNIFYPKSPLHDGAMVLREGKIHAAGCILPLTQNSELNKALGTRHRAAIGMSENSDAVVVVVSEETGTISVAVNGELKRGFDAITLQTELNDLLLSHANTNAEPLHTRLINKIKSIFTFKNTK
ncbi:MAG: diadenylate cyclase CdaA [Clostridia bacterium]|nr:diadenylate cyclase CdaA [Clostridia bacterium]